MTPALLFCFAHPDDESFSGAGTAMRYAAAGGLGVRVWSMAEALAATGVATDLYFVGDPDLPAVERRSGVTLRRWCQAISSGAPAGVYDAEEDKIADLCTWWPAHMADRIAHDAELGAYLDPIADKALLVSVFVTLGFLFLFCAAMILWLPRSID